jgi:hypothetical protein
MAVANPIVPGSPDIDVRCQIAADFYGRKISISGFVEPFPAFEAYAKIEGKLITLAQLSPLEGASPWNLIGEPNRRISGEFYF